MDKVPYFWTSWKLSLKFTWLFWLQPWSGPVGMSSQSPCLQALLMFWVLILKSYNFGEEKALSLSTLSSPQSWSLFLLEPLLVANEEGVVSAKQALVARTAVALFSLHCRYVVALTSCWLARCSLSLTSGIFYIFLLSNSDYRHNSKTKKIPLGTLIWLKL